MTPGGGRTASVSRLSRSPRSPETCTAPPPRLLAEGWVRGRTTRRSFCALRQCSRPHLRLTAAINTAADPDQITDLPGLRPASGTRVALVRRRRRDVTGVRLPQLGCGARWSYPPNRVRDLGDQVVRVAQVPPRQDPATAAGPEWPGDLRPAAHGERQGTRAAVGQSPSSRRRSVGCPGRLWSASRSDPIDRSRP